MKVRDSGMPDEKSWNDFFDTDLILSELQIDSQIGKTSGLDHIWPE
jgi:hypothetical protein